MQNADHDLAPLLRFENIAWYDSGAVRILDRRVYPAREEYVTCKTHREVAQAITDMVTQSYGPFHAAAMGMALAAYECREKNAEKQKEYLRAAADIIANARPTTARKMRTWTDDCERDAFAAIDAGGSALEAVLTGAIEKFSRRYKRIDREARFFLEHIKKDPVIMTQCYGDADLGMLLRALRERGDDARFFTPETRPYLQGARLTASVICDMGFEVTLITDNMPGYVLGHKHVDLFTTSADVITMDGHVVNKVGTFQIALCANYYGVPYYVAGFPDRTHPGVDSVRIEERDAEEVRRAMGTVTCKPGVKGFYPAFDITPPELVTGVATDMGVLKPTELDAYVPAE
ncbi:MAG TPA: s-methyl-5-thioribose-1-phosphate isomerase [Eubacteriales bacterium]|nr:s-methyl-5-thioribose-1-phosphate isomerase [Eubacteriales bacterium]